LLVQLSDLNLFRKWLRLQYLIQKQGVREFHVVVEKKQASQDLIYLDYYVTQSLQVHGLIYTFTVNPGLFCILLSQI